MFAIGLGSLRTRKALRRHELSLLPDPIMPDIAPFSYIIDLLVQIGPSEVTWQEISSWCSLTGIKLSVWESNTIKRLSTIYTSCANKIPRQHSGITVQEY
jgi:hypothetical protein